MKLLHVVLILLASCTVLFATFIVPYDNAKPPSLSLPAAYQLAVTALGPATNQFHCISASISTDFTADGGWLFTFCSANKSPTQKYVTVEFKGKTHVEDIINR